MRQALNVAGTEVLVEGAADSPCIVMLHGWPDTAALWDHTVAALAPRYRCARFTWPGFGPPLPGPHKAAPSLADLTALLHQVVLHVGNGQPVTLLVHDWGCLFGYHFARLHPSLVARVAGVDIGDAGSAAHRRGMAPGQVLGMVGYQLWLAAAWRIGGSLGDRMARAMARRMRVPVKPADIHAHAGYPYWLTWTGAYRAARPFQPAVPMWFAYGQRKPFMFHSDAWCQALAARPGSQVLGLKTGHWVMVDAPQAFHASLLQWLVDTDGA
jgi:pimeloyl-ACP methyl ester carboxylesterase